MSEALRIWLRKTFVDTRKPTSSAASPSGVMPSDSQVGQTISPSGPSPAHANRSPRRAKAKASKTIAISGQKCSGSSKSAALTASLANRLQVLMASSGSTLFRLTWKERVTPSGRLIPALRGSVLRTSGKDSSSWPTPKASDGDRGGQAKRAQEGSRSNLVDSAKLATWPTPTASLATKGVRSHEGAIIEAMRKAGADLGAVASLASWPTPIVNDATGSKYSRDARGNVCLKLPGVAELASWATPSASEAGGTPEQFLARKMKSASQMGISLTSLSLQAKLATWGTPASRDWKDAGQEFETNQEMQQAAAAKTRLAGQAHLVASGKTLNGSIAETGSSGQLNPEFTLWLMGLSTEWEGSRPQAMPSSRKSQRRSSELSSTVRSTSEHSVQSNERPAMGEIEGGNEMANAARKSLLKSLSKASASGVGNNFKDGKYRLAIKKMALEDGFKGTRFQVTFTVMNSTKIAVQSKKTNEVLNVEPNPVGSDVDWMQVKLTDKDSAGPGNIRRLMLDLFGKKEITDEEYEETLAEMCDLDLETGDPLDEPQELAKGMVIDMETVRIVTAKNKIEIVATKWSHVEQTEADQARVKKWLEDLAAQQEVSAAEEAAEAAA